MNVTEVQPKTRNSFGIEANAFNLGSSSSAKFTLEGGYYTLDVVATFGGGTVKVQAVGPDGSTLINTALTLSANGTISGALPPGTYQITVTTATAVYASVTSVPDARP
jgi:hypothetical protein